MRPYKRRAAIARRVRAAGKITVEELALELNTSRETIRRDLTELAMEGKLRKIHGGATTPDSQMEVAFANRLTENYREKKVIAELAKRFFKEGDAIFMDNGTTTLAVAEELASSPRMTVITNSFLIAQTLSQGNSDHKVFVVGGEYSSDSAETSGPLVVSQLREFNADGAVITVGSISLKGIMDFESRHAEIARTMIQQANFVTVVADGSKFTNSAVFKICDLDEIDRIIVNIEPEAAIEKALAAARIEIISPISKSSK